MADEALEPFVEVIVGKEINAYDGNFLHAKSARTLHLPFTDGSENVVVELLATLKFRVAKSDLSKYTPSTAAKLSTRSRTTLRRWLAARYIRAAFAEAFLDRFEKYGLDEKFKKAVAKTQSHLVAIYFDVDDGKEIERAAEDDVYVLSVYLVHAVDDDPAVSRTAAEAVKLEVETMFVSRCQKDGEWRGIQLEGCYVYAKTELSIDDADKLQKWNTDYISLRGEPLGPMMGA